MKKKGLVARVMSAIVDSSPNEGWGSQVYPVDMLQYDDNDEGAVEQKKDMTARLAWMEAGGYYGYKKSTRNMLQENYSRGKRGNVDVTFAKYLLDGRAVWVFEYEHNTKTVDNLPWHKWYELPEKERGQWHPTIRYGVKADDSDDDLLDMPMVWPDDKEFITTFAEAFWSMAATWLGMKLDKDAETVQLKVPKHNHGKMPRFTIGIPGKSVYICFGFNVSTEGMEELSDEDRDAFMIAAQKGYEELGSALKGVSNHDLKGKEGKEPKGAKKTDYDLLREAFKWVQKNVSGCRDGYADDGVAMINDNEERKRPIEAILANMKLSGSYEDVIVQYEELKKKPEGGDSGKGDDGTESENEDDSRILSKDIKLKIEDYERMEEEYKNLETVTKKYPYEWDMKFSGEPIYEKARDTGALRELPHMEITVFELCIRFLRAGQLPPTRIEDFAERESGKSYEALYGKKKKTQ